MLWLVSLSVCNMLHKYSDLAVEQFGRTAKAGKYT